jgi:hypothetical protein
MLADVPNRACGAETMIVGCLIWLLQPTLALAAGSSAEERRRRESARQGGVYRVPRKDKGGAHKCNRVALSQACAEDRSTC